MRSERVRSIVGILRFIIIRGVSNFLTGSLKFNKQVSVYWSSIGRESVIWRRFFFRHKIIVVDKLEKKKYEWDKVGRWVVRVICTIIWSGWGPGGRTGRWPPIRTKFPSWLRFGRQTSWLNSRLYDLVERWIPGFNKITGFSGTLVTEWFSSTSLRRSKSRISMRIYNSRSSVVVVGLGGPYSLVRTQTETCGLS